MPISAVVRLPYMTTLAERIQEALDEAGFLAADLARACGVKPPSVSAWLSSETKSLKAATAIRAAEFLGVNQLWLTEGRGPKRPRATSEPHPTAPPDDFVAVRRVRLKVSAGVTGFSVEPLNGDGLPIFFRADWLKLKRLRADRLIAVRVNGDSMSPGLYDGDLVVINTEDVEPRDGDVFVVNYEGEAVIKRMKRDGGMWWLSSDNPDKSRYADKRCDEHAVVVGRVIYKQSEHI